MTTRPTTSTADPDGPVRAAERISGPAELLQAVPYLLGFHPRRSLVLVGLRGGVLVVTARIDLDDAIVRGVLTASLHSMCEGGATEVIAAVYDDGVAAAVADRVVTHGASASEWDDPLPWWPLVDDLAEVVDDLACRLHDVLLVVGGRWWSYSCDVPGCCPVEGNVLPDDPSAFAAAATYSGVVPLPGREALAELLTPLDDATRHALDPALASAENAACAAALHARAQRHERSVKRAIFAAARASAEPRWVGADDETVARYAAGLLETTVRDAVWMAIDDRRLDGRALWRDLARRVPAPYDTAPLFLYGWASWRAGNGALAGIAAERALTSDPGYTAADLLLAAVSQNVDPRRVPRLRRSA